MLVEIWTGLVFCGAEKQDQIIQIKNTLQNHQLQPMNIVNETDCCSVSITFNHIETGVCID